MTPPTPETLRKLAVTLRSGASNFLAQKLFAAADAWEADIKWRDAMLEYFDVECAALRKRLEGAEKAIREKEARIAALEEELDRLRLFASPIDQVLADHYGTTDPAHGTWGHWVDDVMDYMPTDEGDK